MPLPPAFPSPPGGAPAQAAFAPGLGLSTARSALLMLSDLAIWVASACAAAASGSPLVYGLAWLCIGSRMRALDNLVHEASHRLLSRHCRLNDAAGAVCSALLLTGFRRYRAEHLRHHARLGTPQDPDLLRYHQIGLAELPRVLRPIPLLRALPRGYWRYVAGGARGTSPRAQALRRAAGMLSACITALAFGGTAALEAIALYWLVPLLSTYQGIRFIVEAGEHAALYQRAPASAPLRVRAVAMTRNMRVNPLLGLFLYPHGDAHHMLHHRFPGVPGPCLTRLRAALERQGWHRGIRPENWASPLLGRGGLMAQFSADRAPRSGRSR